MAAGGSGGGLTGGSPAATMLAAMSVIQNRLAPLAAPHDGRGRHLAPALAAAPLKIRAEGGGAEAVASSPQAVPGTPSLSIASDAAARQQGLMWSGAL